MNEESLRSSEGRGSRAVLVIATIAVLVHIGLHAPLAASKVLLEHDEAISYLVARGHVDESSRMEKESVERVEFRPVREWQALVTADAPLDLREVSRNLAEYDIHPPLYFWLLSAGVSLFGFHLSVGLLLNLVVDLVALGLVHRLGKLLLRDERKASWAALLWAVSPGVLIATAEARQYSLAGLAAALLFCGVEGVVRSSHGEKKWWAVALALGTGAGLFTSYQFAIPVAAAGVSFLVLTRDDVRKWGLAGLVVGTLPLVADAKTVLGCLKRQQAILPSSGTFLTRLELFFAAPGRFFVIYKGQAVLFALLVIAMGFWLVRQKRLSKSDTPLSVWLMSGAFAFIGLAFLAGRSPSWALNAKYLSWAYPGLACLVVDWASKATPHRAQWSLGVLATWMGLNAAWSTTQDVQRERAAASVQPKVHDAANVVIDDTSRGNVIPIVIHLRPDARVLVADAAALRASTERWASSIGPETLWVHVKKSNFKAEELSEALTGQPDVTAKEDPLFIGPRQAVYTVSKTNRQ